MIAPVRTLVPNLPENNGKKLIFVTEKQKKVVSYTLSFLLNNSLIS